MGTRLILTGFIFLLNPEIMMLDILPDFIGYILIASGLKKLARIDEDFAAAKKTAVFLTLLSLVKFGFSPIVFLTNIKSNKLTVQFLFAVGEGILGFLFSRSFVHGVDMISIRDFGDCVNEKFGENKLLLYALFPVKICLLLLPQTVVLFYPDIDAPAEEVLDFVKMSRNYSFSFNSSLILSSLLLLGFAFALISSFSRYRKSIVTNEVYSKGMAEFYAERFEKNEKKVTLSEIKSAFFFATVSTVFLLGFFIDNVSVVPRFLFFVFAFISVKKALTVLQKKSKAPLLILFSGILNFFIYIYETFCALYYKTEFELRFVKTLSGIIIESAKELTTAISFVFLFLILSRLVGHFGSKTGLIRAFSFIIVPFCLISFINFVFSPENMIYPVGMWILGIMIIVFAKSILSNIFEVISRKIKDE